MSKTEHTTPLTYDALQHKTKGWLIDALVMYGKHNQHREGYIEELQRRNSELLEELEALVEGAYWDGISQKWRFGMADDLMIKAKAAIAKAKGEGEQ